MKTHDLKIWPEYFDAVETGLKNFEIRLDDRGFKVGDRLHLREWDRFRQCYTGRETSREVTYIFQGSGIGVSEGVVIMSLK